ncbi:complex III assembly factor LYRM7 [Macrobrachium rosenbergii]|uniref:complex III assembly factor LYRM7 n=1 Tax=Macrobrachium rosenbergii TaxID=79674 RepID=UPI0034D429E6
MSLELRGRVLSCFKQLHRARAVAFQGDEAALAAARLKINSEFVKNKGVTDAEAVEELIKYGRQVEQVLRKHVLQAVQTDVSSYRAQIREDITMLDNIPFQDMPSHMIGPFRRRKKCGDPESKGG